jgi:ATP-dependent RNA helicase RhlE
LLFSATMPPAIAKLAHDILKDPVRIDISPAVIAVDRIDQRVVFVGAKDKRALLTQLLRDANMDRVLVFTRTKRGADRVSRQLAQAGIAADALHGNKAQNARVRALDAFRSGSVRVLVATDIAARGIDVPGISHVINYELPNEPESYVHRIGRTARAGAGGAALSFCDQNEQPYLRAIESLMRRKVTVAEFRPTESAAERVPLPKRQRPQGARPASAGKRRRRSHARGFPGLPGGVPKFANRERAVRQSGETR